VSATLHINRRSFLQNTLVATALTASSPALLAETSRAKTTTQTFCAFEKPLQFLSADELADLITELGFDGIEATVRDQGRVLPEKVEEDLPRLSEALKKRGREITILTSGINSVDSPHAEKVLRTAARLGIKRYRMLWYRYDLEKPILPQLEAIRPKLKQLAALNRELGLTALYQNHAGANMVGAPLWDLYELIKEFSPREIAVAFDIRHAAVEGGLSWPVQFKLLQPQLGSVFVKDYRWENGKVLNVPLGQGQVDRKFFAMLKSAPFSGPISLHVEYFSGEPDKTALTDAFRRDFVTLRSWITD